MKFSVVIPTYNGGELWRTVAKSISSQSVKPNKVLVIDSTSSDATIDIALEHGFTTHLINKKSFNHGGTRNLAVEFVSDSEVIIFLTQDAILESNYSFAEILTSFEQDEHIAAVCGRQLPHDNANPLAAHARWFNYPVDSCVKSIEDIPRFGIKTAFMSNSFAAYRCKVFFELGGFPENTILAEDMYIAAKMIHAGYKVMYSAKAAVKHSHNYTPVEEFCRYFDTGVFHANESWIRDLFGNAEGEGMMFIRSELAYLWQNSPSWIPRALFTNGCKLLGYKLGQNYRYLPWMLRHRFSMYKAYWLQNKC